VELAQLNYLLPRLTGRGAQMSRQGGKGAGGAGGAGGGGGRIGVRGPGEKKLETDRRRIRDRAHKIEVSIDEARKQRALRREARLERMRGRLGGEGSGRIRGYHQVGEVGREGRAHLGGAGRRNGSGEELPVLVSGLTGEGLDELLRRIDAALPMDPIVKLSL